MKKQYRLTRNIDFQKIIATKQSVSNGVFIVYYAKSDVDHLRVGLSVGKKMGNAVQRNYIKRQIRAMADEVLDFSVPYNLIIISRPKFNLCSFQDNRKDLLQVLKKIKIEEQYSLIRKEIFLT